MKLARGPKLVCLYARSGPQRDAPALNPDCNPRSRPICDLLNPHNFPPANHFYAFFQKGNIKSNIKFFPNLRGEV
jgi:hypothetical protein